MYLKKASSHECSIEFELNFCMDFFFFFFNQKNNPSASSSLEDADCRYATKLNNAKKHKRSSFTLQTFYVAWGWLENEWIFICGWSVNCLFDPI